MRWQRVVVFLIVESILSLSLFWLKSFYKCSWILKPLAQLLGNHHARCISIDPTIDFINQLNFLCHCWPISLLVKEFDQMVLNMRRHGAILDWSGLTQHILFVPLLYRGSCPFGKARIIFFSTIWVICWCNLVILLVYCRPFLGERVSSLRWHF